MQNPESLTIKNITIHFISTILILKIEYPKEYNYFQQ